MNEERSLEILNQFKNYNKFFEDLTTTMTFETKESMNIAIETLLTSYEKQKDKIKKAIDFINDENNFFEDGENWQNVLKIKEILEEKNEKD